MRRLHKIPRWVNTSHGSHTAWALYDRWDRWVGAVRFGYYQDGLYFSTSFGETRFATLDEAKAFVESEAEKVKA